MESVYKKLVKNKICIILIAASVFLFPVISKAIEEFSAPEMTEKIPPLEPAEGLEGQPSKATLTNQQEQAQEQASDITMESISDTSKTPDAAESGSFVEVEKETEGVVGQQEKTGTIVVTQSIRERVENALSTVNLLITDILAALRKLLISSTSGEIAQFSPLQVTRVRELATKLDSFQAKLKTMPTDVNQSQASVLIHEYGKLFEPINNQVYSYLRGLQGSEAQTGREYINDKLAKVTEEFNAAIISLMS